MSFGDFSSGGRQDRRPSAKIAAQGAASSSPTADYNRLGDDDGDYRGASKRIGDDIRRYQQVVSGLQKLVAIVGTQRDWRGIRERMYVPITPP